jgi:insertion element IS1 protein InsB
MKTLIKCPCCEGINLIKNGFSPSGKQNRICKDCDRQFLENSQDRFITEYEKNLIRKLLLERISLAGICRVVKVSYNWLLNFAEEEYKKAPDHLNVILPKSSNFSDEFKIEVCEGDELWSFVGNRKDKKNVVWVWLIIHVESRQIMSLYCGDRTAKSAQKLWDKLPETIKNNGFFYTDYCKSYLSVIPDERHEAVGKDSGLTNNVEGFNCILRQRVSRLVRETLSFSKKFANHVGAIKYFICHHNLTVNSSYT